MFKKLLFLIVIFVYTQSSNFLIAQDVLWESRGIGGGGALFSPSVNPLNDNEMYITCDMTGMYHTTNSGVNWETLPFLPKLLLPRII